MNDESSPHDAQPTITDADIDVTYVATRLRRFSRLERGATMRIHHPRDFRDVADERPDPILWDEGDAPLGSPHGDMFKYP